MTFRGTSLGCCIGGRPLCLVRLLLKRCSPFLLFFLLYWPYPDPCVLPFTVKERLELESEFDEWVQAAVQYARMIEDFNELIDPHTLAHHCLGPEPSLYVLSALDREEKKRKLPWYPGRFSSQPASCFLCCRDDVQVQQGDVQEDQGEEE